jgi:hypothetical protein
MNPSFRRIFLALLLALVGLFLATSAAAAPGAHILRIDPRAGVADGKPILTTVVEVVELTPISRVLMPCANVRGYEATMTCWSEQYEKDKSLWSAWPFPEDRGRFLVKVDGSDRPTRFVDKVQWGKAKAQPGVGTAWLIALDASASMGPRYGDAQQVAHAIIASMQPNDIMELMIFDDRQVVQDSKWKLYTSRNDLVATLKAQPGVMPQRPARFTSPRKQQRRLDGASRQFFGM